MLIINFIVIFIMMVGLLCTLAPRLHGAVLIGIIAGSYGMVVGINIVHSWIGLTLLVVLFIGEFGSGVLRIFFTRHFEVTRSYSVDTMVCNFAGIIIADALLGSLLGMFLWEVLVGKVLFPRLDGISQVLLRLMFIGMLRFLCGLVMIFITIKYIMYPN